MCRGQMPLMNPPPMMCTRSARAASSMPATQRGASPGLLNACCTNDATSHGPSDGAAQHSRQQVSVNRTRGCRWPSMTSLGPGLGQSTQISLSGATRARCFSQAAAMISSP